MKVYRITKAKYSQDLSGTGAKLYGGRWNSKGTAILYTAENKALAALKSLVHFDPVLVPKNLKIITIEIPKRAIKNLGQDKLPKGWKSNPVLLELSEIGKKWVESNSSLALKVPSVIIPGEYNVLVNPEHKLFSTIKILEQEDFSFDERLFE